MGVEIHKGLISPALDKLTQISGGRIGSEQQHVAVREALHYAERIPFAMDILEKFSYKNPERLGVNLAGIELDGCVGIGGGWDKPGRTVWGLHQAGASWVEIGTSVPLDQPGNDSTKDNPRQRYKDGIALNSLGFNAHGVVSDAHNLEYYVGRKDLKIGVSIGKNKTTADNFTPASHYFVAKRLLRYADYIVLNVSSPNTPNLRELQEKSKLIENGQAVNQAMKEEGVDIPAFVKVSEMSEPELSDVIEAVYDLGWKGIIGPNTTVRTDIKGKYGYQDLPGGLSGDDPDYIDIAVKLMAFIYKETNGKMTTVGIGGVNQRTIWERFTRGGVTAVQMVTDLRQDGLLAPSKSSISLIDRMDREGVKHISEIRGQDIR